MMLKRVGIIPTRFNIYRGVLLVTYKHEKEKSLLKDLERRLEYYYNDIWMGARYKIEQEKKIFIKELEERYEPLDSKNTEGIRDESCDCHMKIDFDWLFFEIRKL